MIEGLLKHLHCVQDVGAFSIGHSQGTTSRRRRARQEFCCLRQGLGGLLVSTHKHSARHLPPVDALDEVDDPLVSWLVHGRRCGGEALNGDMVCLHLHKVTACIVQQELCLGVLECGHRLEKSENQRR